MLCLKDNIYSMNKALSKNDINYAIIIHQIMAFVAAIFLFVDTKSIAKLARIYDFWNRAESSGLACIEPYRLWTRMVRPGYGFDFFLLRWLGWEKKIWDFSHIWTYFHSKKRKMQEKYRKIKY